MFWSLEIPFKTGFTVYEHIYVSDITVDKQLQRLAKFFISSKNKCRQMQPTCEHAVQKYVTE